MHRKCNVSVKKESHDQLNIAYQGLLLFISGSVLHL